MSTPFSRRSLLVHVSLPAWSPTSSRKAAWQQWVGPLLEGIVQAGPVGLVMQGRMLAQDEGGAPGAIAALREAVREGRVEPVATALHAPVLSAIPERDALAQIRTHVTLLKQVLGVRPMGMWVPYGVWEPSLPRVLARAGLSWTTLAKTWLEAGGVRRAARLSVEREGRAVIVLPHGPPHVGWEGLAVVRVRDETGVAEALEAAARSEVLPSVLTAGPRARAYPSAGGADGLWERHLLEDAGADALHKRMLAVSRGVRRLKRATEAGRHSDDGPDPRDLQQARRYLFRAQAAEAYVPVLPAVRVRGSSRDRAWRDLLRSELQVARALDEPEVMTELVDFDCDGAVEVRLRTESWAVTLAPEREGMLTEISWLKGAINVLGGTLPIGFRERWGDGQPLAMAWSLVTHTTQGVAARAVMVADATMGEMPVRVTKRVDLPGSTALTLSLEIQNRGDGATRALLTSEIFLALGGPREEEDCSLSVEVAGGKVPLDEVVELPPLDAVGVIGWRARVEILTSPPARVIIEPLEEGVARVAVSWPVELWPRDRERREIRLIVREEHHG